MVESRRLTATCATTLCGRAHYCLPPRCRRCGRFGGYDSFADFERVKRVEPRWVRSPVAHRGSKLSCRTIGRCVTPVRCRTDTTAESVRAIAFGGAGDGCGYPAPHSTSEVFDGSISSSSRYVTGHMRRRRLLNFASDMLSELVRVPVRRCRRRCDFLLLVEPLRPIRIPVCEFSGGSRRLRAAPCVRGGFAHSMGVFHPESIDPVHAPAPGC